MRLANATATARFFDDDGNTAMHNPHTATSQPHPTHTTRQPNTRRSQDHQIEIIDTLTKQQNRTHIHTRSSHPHPHTHTYPHSYMRNRSKDGEWTSTAACPHPSQSHHTPAQTHVKEEGWWGGTQKRRERERLINEIQTSITYKFIVAMR